MTSPPNREPRLLPTLGDGAQSQRTTSVYRRLWENTTEATPPSFAVHHGKSLIRGFNFDKAAIPVVVIRVLETAT